MQQTRMGWQCPRCNTCYSPDISSCAKCSHKTVVPNPAPVLPGVIPALPGIVPPFPAYPPPIVSPYTLRGVAKNSGVEWISGCGPTADGGWSFLTEKKSDG